MDTSLRKLALNTRKPSRKLVQQMTSVTLITLTAVIFTCCSLSATSLEIGGYKSQNMNEIQIHNLKMPITTRVTSQNLSKYNKSQPRRDPRRPIWNVAHMVNSINELDYRLTKGANSVEVDVTFDSIGAPSHTYHGQPCDCMRHCHQSERMKDYLQYVNEIAIADPNGIGANLSLLFMDLKLDHLHDRSKAKAGYELANIILDNLYSVEEPLADKSSLVKAYESLSANCKLRLVISINHVNDIELINYFVHQLEERNATQLLKLIGFDVGMNDDLQLIETMWHRYGKDLNLWQGDGFTNCFSPFYNLERLSKAIVKRDSDLGYPRKVYQWTIDLRDRMREALMMGVDAIMTNHPERLLNILTEPDIAHSYRLATRDDDPFQKLVKKSTGRISESARHQRSAIPSNGGFLASVYDVLSSFIAYLKEIPMLGFPSRARYIGGLSRVRNLSRPKTGPQSRNAQTTVPISTFSTKLEGRMAGIDTSDTSSDHITSTFAQPNSTSTLSPMNITIVGVNSTTTIVFDSNTTNIISSTQATSIDSDTNPPTLIDYEAPSWYMNFASNFLISLLKLTLPVHSTNSTVTSTTTTAAPITTTTSTTAAS